MSVYVYMGVDAVTLAIKVWHLCCMTAAADSSLLDLCIVKSMSQCNGLDNVFEFQNNSVKELLSCEDNEGCTPLHYACRLGIHESVKNMLGLSGQVGLECKSKDKKSALHFAAQWVELVPEGIRAFHTTGLNKNDLSCLDFANFIREVAAMSPLQTSAGCSCYLASFIIFTPTASIPLHYC